MTTQANFIYTSIPSVAVKAKQEAEAAAKAAKSLIYIPIVQDGPKHAGKTYIPELRNGDTTFATIVADIASAQHDNVVRVIAVDVALGTSRDATAEVARHVLDAVLEDDYHVPDWCRDFLEEHLGVNFVRAAERGAA